MSLLINAKSVNDAFIQIAKELLKNSDFTSFPRGAETKEILGVFIVIKNPYNRLVTNIHRKISLKYLIGEWLWYERGSNFLEEISYYSKFWKGISDDKKTANSAYGHRILGFHSFIKVNQWEWTKKQLLKDRETRRAIIFISVPSDIKRKTKDFPCTVALQFFIRNDRLSLMVLMRSNDLVLGFTYDAASFTLFQEKMLIELKKYYPGLKMGNYFHVVTSMHVYKSRYQMLENILDDQNNNVKINIPHMDNLKEIKKLQYNEKIIRTNSKKRTKKLKDQFCIWCQNILLNK